MSGCLCLTDACVSAELQPTKAQSQALFWRVVVVICVQVARYVWITFLHPLWHTYTHLKFFKSSGLLFGGVQMCVNLSCSVLVPVGVQCTEGKAIYFQTLQTLAQYWVNIDNSPPPVQIQMNPKCLPLSSSLFSVVLMLN